MNTVSWLSALFPFAAFSAVEVTAQGDSTVPAPSEALAAILNPVQPDVDKWASVVLIDDPEADAPAFTWHHLEDSYDAVDFWPASTIKLYTVVAAIEWLNAEGLPLESTIEFSRGAKGGGDRWILDCARTVPEMVSEVFRRSSNEDYTLLLRMVGIDHINTQFLIPEKGFPHTALMRDYVTWRPVLYENDEPQKIRVLVDGREPKTYLHTWSGRSYAQERGASVISATTGNCTSTRELAECLRRIVFHDRIPERERYAISSEQARWILEGQPERGVVGLANKDAGDYGWGKSGEVVFPNARYYHKAGQISTYTLDLCYLTDAESGTHVILSIAAKTGDEQVVRDMAKAVYEGIASGAL